MSARLLAVPIVAIIGLVTIAGSAIGQQPRHGGTAVFVIDTDPPSLNPALTTGATDDIVGTPMNATLMIIDADGRLRPYVAESWAVSPDGHSVTFRLRHDVKFQDGTPLTSADVKFTFEEVLAKYHPQASKAFAYVSSVDVPDPYTVVVQFKQPYGPFFQLTGGAPVLPRHLYQGTDILKNPHNLQPVGAGPFKFQEWVRGDHITVVRNANYFEPGLPYLDQIVYKMIPDPHARTIAIQTGEVDYIHDYYFNRADYAQIAHRPDLMSKLDPGFPEDDLVIFNVRSAPLSNVKVRQAIAYAIDRRQLIERVYRGLGGVSHSAIDTRMPWAYNPAVDYERIYAYNPAVSEKLLDEAGYLRKAGGTRFQVRLTFDPGHPGFLDMGQVLRDALHRVGIDVQLVSVERNVMINQVFMSWDFDMTLQNYATAGDPAVGVQRLYICSDVRKAPFVNASGYCNPPVDALFAQGAAQLSQSARAEAYKKVQVLLARDIPSFPVVQLAEVDVARAVLKGLWQIGEPSYYFAQISTTQ